MPFGRCRIWAYGRWSPPVFPISSRATHCEMASPRARFRRDLLGADCIRYRNGNAPRSGASAATFVDSGSATTFEVDAFWKHRLLKGIDDIDATMASEAQLKKYEAAIHVQAPAWDKSTFGSNTAMTDQLNGGREGRLRAGQLGTLSITFFAHCRRRTTCGDGWRRSHNDALRQWPRYPCSLRRSDHPFAALRRRLYRDGEG